MAVGDRIGIADKETLDKVEATTRYTSVDVKDILYKMNNVNGGTDWKQYAPSSMVKHFEMQGQESFKSILKVKGSGYVFSAFAFPSVYTRITVDDRIILNTKSIGVDAVSGILNTSLITSKGSVGMMSVPNFKIEHPYYNPMSIENIEVAPLPKMNPESKEGTTILLSSPIFFSKSFEFEVANSSSVNIDNKIFYFEGGVKNV